jgi:2-succinyl-5-enolpyruvyl-6-hydroxy-3-cyclohexene-1-carboxylate synthase
LKNTTVNLVVINNGGGKIFSGMFQQKEFQNQHGIEFRAWADLWGLDYILWNEIPETFSSDSLLQVQGRSRVIEVQPAQ